MDFCKYFLYNIIKEMGKHMKKCKFAPYMCYKDIYKIDYNKLYSDGVKIILFDLDNTIIGYHETLPSEEDKLFITSLKERGFIPVIMSNNHTDRIENVAAFLNVDKLSNAKKPLKFGYKKILKRYSEYRPEQFVAIGDQIVTDIWGASRMNIKGILVKPIRLDNEKWYTRFNRRIEKFIIKHKIKKYNIELYKTILDVKGE